MAHAQGQLTERHVAAALGFDPYKSPLEVWYELTGKRKPSDGAEAPDDRRKRRAIERQSKLESECDAFGGEELETITGMAVVREELPRTTLEPWASATPRSAWRISDGELVLGMPKTVSGAEMFHKRWGEQNTDQVSDPVLIAAHWQMHHFPDVRRTLVPTLIGGWTFNFSWWMIGADKDLGEQIYDQARTWYEAHVRKDMMPSPIPRDNPLLARLWPGRKNKEMRGDVDAIELAVEAKRLKIEVDRLKHANDVACTKLRNLMQDATALRWGKDRKVTLSISTTKKLVDWQRVATELGAKIDPEDYGALLKACTYEKQTPRTMRISIPGFAEEDEDDDG